MDPATRVREAEDAWDEEFVFLSDPAENRWAIRYFADLRAKYEYAADHPEPRSRPI